MRNHHKKTNHKAEASPDVSLSYKNVFDDSLLEAIKDIGEILPEQKKSYDVRFWGLTLPISIGAGFVAQNTPFFVERSAHFLGTSNLTIAGMPVYGIAYSAAFVSTYVATGAWKYSKDISNIVTPFLVVNEACQEHSLFSVFNSEYSENYERVTPQVRDAAQELKLLAKKFASFKPGMENSATMSRKERLFSDMRKAGNSIFGHAVLALGAAVAPAIVGVADLIAFAGTIYVANAVNLPYAPAMTAVVAAMVAMTGASYKFVARPVFERAYKTSSRYVPD